MRCPYCQAINQDQAIYCARCGRDMRPPPPPQSSTSYQPPRQAPQYQPPRQTPPQAARPTPPVSTRIRQQEIPFRPAAPVAPPVPVAPDPPVPFPPRTIADLQALEQGALPYTVVNDSVEVGHKKVVRIAYIKCIPWQQVATLLKASKEQQRENFETIIIQGVLPQDTGVYSFTNGQLRFDRNVRLGSQVTNRYQIETGNGYESDSVRIVLTEQ
jgi:hypothetical protein